MLGLVEVAGEADLVANLEAVGRIPGVRRVGQDLAAEERLDAALLGQRDLLGVAEVGVRLVLDDGWLTVDRGREEAAEGVRGDISLVDFPDDGRRGLRALDLFLERLDLLGRIDAFGVDALDPERPLDGDLPVAEGLVGEYLRLLRLLEGQEGVADAPDVLV